MADSNAVNAYGGLAAVRYALTARCATPASKKGSQIHDNDVGKRPDHLHATCHICCLLSPDDDGAYPGSRRN